MMYWVLGSLIFLFSSGIFILIALFYDHRKNPSIAIKYLLSFIILMAIGVAGIFIFNIYFAILCPFWLFGMLISKKIFDEKLNKSSKIENMHL